jgi:hypothetical protein
MFTDTMGFELKVAVFKNLVTSHSFSNLHSFRDAQIQVEKLERMTEKFAAKYPIEVVMALPLKKLKKARGVDRHRVSTQSKIVDRVCMKLMEELVIDSETAAGGKNLTKAQVKRVAQKYIETLNGNIHKAFQNRLKEAFAATVAGLGGLAEPGTGQPRITS